ncbi:hypothetical protein ABPG77_003641 [Micractinium sp. CCAP 211/92]
MTVLLPLLRAARQLPAAWYRPRLPSGSHIVAIGPAATGGGSTGSRWPPAASASSAAALHSSSSSSSSRQAGPARHQRRRRAVPAAAGRRGNMFLDDAAARPPPSDEQSAARLFDSSRFNYDSDEEEEEEQQRGAAAEAGEQQQQRPAASPGEEGDGGVLEVPLPPPRGVRVKTAEFIKSSVNVAQCPPPRFPEFAVIGRSNVGKSSLINLLTGRSSLAMVSKTPGKTRCINHFLINGAWYLVDLPGYGYARTSKGNVVEWNRFTREYFTERETLVTVLLLVDASIPPMALDISCAAWFAEAEIPFTIVFTKLDKRKKGGPPAEENIAAFEAQVEEACGYVPPTILTSSKNGKGRNELLAHVAQLREFYNKQHHGM